MLTHLLILNLRTEVLMWHHVIELYLKDKYNSKALLDKQMCVTYLLVSKGPFTLFDLRLRSVFAHNGLYRSW